MAGVTIELVPAVTDEVGDLIGELDATLAAEYLPEQRHGLSLASIFQPHIRFFIARLNGTAAGCGGIAFFPNLNPGFSEVKRMFVRPASRGQGIAQAILRRLEQESLQNGLATLRLETGIRQPAAIRLYECSGYARCAAFEPYASMPPDAVATSIYYEKRISA